MSDCAECKMTKGSVEFKDVLKRIISYWDMDESDFLKFFKVEKQFSQMYVDLKCLEHLCSSLTAAHEYLAEVGEIGEWGKKYDGHEVAALVREEYAQFCHVQDQKRPILDRIRDPMGFAPLGEEEYHVVPTQVVRPGEDGFHLFSKFPFYSRRLEEDQMKALLGWAVAAPKNSEIVADVIWMKSFDLLEKRCFYSYGWGTFYVRNLKPGLDELQTAEIPGRLGNLIQFIKVLSFFEAMTMRHIDALYKIFVNRSVLGEKSEHAEEMKILSRAEHYLAEIGSRYGASLQVRRSKPCEDTTILDGREITTVFQPTNVLQLLCEIPVGEITY